MTFRVKTPAFTPTSDTIYITGQSAAVSPDPLCGYCGGNAATAMHETAPGSHIWEITLGIPDRFIEHGSREDCLVQAELDQASLAAAVERWWSPLARKQARSGT